ncbi:hypothetical protein, partial [Nocardiopsis sp. MG754419]|uniref:hypothetical protein n=1 Tax=Nocardiopsis sp. MG754419 TaxID=2259865 RepID=UPI001BA4C73B
RGPLLHDVLSALEVEVVGASRRVRAGALLELRGADGHHAVVSWAEIDPGFADLPVLLAVEMDAAPLGGAGPQLVIPTDACGTRFVNGVVEIDVHCGTGSFTAQAGPPA